MSGFAKFVLFLTVTTAVIFMALWIIGGRPNKASVEATIDARPDEVFSWLIDPEKRAKWVTNLDRTVVEMDESGEKPAKLVSTYRNGDQTENHDEMVQQFDADQFLSLKSSVGGVQTTNVFRLDQKGNRVQLKYEVIEKARSFWKLKYAMQAADLQTQIQTEILELKRLAEKNSDMPFLFGDPVRNEGQ